MGRTIDESEPLTEKIVRQTELPGHSVEPWVQNGDGYLEAGDHTDTFPNTLNINAPGNLARAIKCVNSLAGIENTENIVGTLKWLLRWNERAKHGHRCPLRGSEFSEAFCLRCETEKRIKDILE